MLELTDQNFEQEVSKSQMPILVDFWSTWCQPCLILSPILEKMEKDYEDRMILAKVNVDLAPLVSQKFGIESIPTVVLFKEGKPISGFIGLRPEQAIKEWLEKVLKNNHNQQV